MTHSFLHFFSRLNSLFSSFGLATATLVLLLIVTFLGTLEQAEFGLVASQERYFESFFVDRIDLGACWRALALNAYLDIGDVTLPMPLGFTTGVQTAYTMIFGGALLFVCGYLLARVVLPWVNGTRTSVDRGGVIALVLFVLLVGTGVTRSSLLPGGYTLMAVLFVNLFLGGIVRIRKSPQTVGVIISHFAILFMIASGAVSYHFGEEGGMTLVEGETSDEFLSFHERVIEIEKVRADNTGPRTALVIDQSKYRDLSGDRQRTFTHDSLPFDLSITGWYRHAQPVRDTAGTEAQSVDGYYLMELDTLDESGAVVADERLASACLAIVTDKTTGSVQRGLLWEFAAAPWTVAVGDEQFLISLARRSHKLPFAIRLDKTEQEKHPGTERSRRFTSWVTKLTDGEEEKRVITMNEPVRSQGYAVFQQTFDDGTSSGSGVKRSGFQIVENPSDHWPLISCVIVAEGLLLHFLMMLARFIKVRPWRFALSLIAVFNAAFALAIWKLL